MKIRKVRLENTLSHVENVFELDSLTCFRGENGSGKSTIVAAAQTVVAGICEYTDERGAGIKSLIRVGEDKAGITVEIADAGEAYTLHNSITQKSGRIAKCIKESDPSATCKDYLAGLAISRDILACLFNGAYFFEKDEKEQKRLLASIVLPREAEFAPWAWQTVLECGLQVDRSQPPFELIQATYKAAFDERRDTNRLLKDWQEPAKPEPQSMTSSDIRARLTERQNARTARAVDRDRILHTWEANRDKRAHVALELEGERDGLGNTKKAGLRDKLTAEGARQAEAERLLLSKSALKEHEKLAAGETKAGAINTALQANGEKLRSVRRELSAFNDAFEKGMCSTCTRELSDDVGVQIGQRFFNQVTALEQEDHKLQTELRELGDWMGAKKNLLDHEQAERNLKTIRIRIDDLRKEIDAAARFLDAPAPTQPDTANIDAEIAELDARIEKGNAALQEAIRSETLAVAYSAAIKRKADLEKKAKDLDALVKYFSADGVLSEILGKSVAPFQTRMNAVLKGWGYACQLGFDPYAFEVYIADGETRNFIPLRTLSKSQRASFQVAFQVALAIVTGYKFVWVDAADIWLEEPRRAMYQAVLAAELDQVVVLQSDTRREIPQRPNSVFYMLRLDRSSGIPTTVAERLEPIKAAYA